jgi:hypothetical protein
VIICVLGQIGILVASLIGLSPYRRMARWYWVGFGSLMALIFLTTTNYLGIFTPGPSLTLETNISPGTAELVVSVYNRGNRDLILTRARGHLSNTFICSVNAVGEQGSSRPVPAPVSTEVFGGNALAARSGGTQIHPNGFVRMHYRLPGGEYEALLAEAAPNAQPFERQSITIEVPPPPPEPTPASTLNDDGLPGAVTTAPLPEPPRFGDAENPANSEGEPPPPPPPPGTRVLLRGVVAAPESTPKVSITVFLPNMAPNLKNIAMGEAVVGPWKAQEYNPQLQTVTISDGTRMLVLRKGELILL